MTRNVSGSKWLGARNRPLGAWIIESVPLGKYRSLDSSAPRFRRMSSIPALIAEIRHAPLYAIDSNALSARIKTGDLTIPRLIGAPGGRSCRCKKYFPLFTRQKNRAKTPANNG